MNYLKLVRVMGAYRQQSSPASRPFQWLAVALSLLMLALGPLAVRPDWHATVHAVHVHTGDAPDADHDHSHDAPPDERGCVIALFAAGHIDMVAFPSPVINLVRAVVFELTSPAGRPTPAPSLLEPPGRAPPFSA